MPFVPDNTATADAPPRRGGFVPDAAPPAPAAAPAPAVPLGQLGAAAVPGGADAQWQAGQSPEQIAARQRRDFAARNPVTDKVVGAVEAALDIAAKVVGGGVGGIAGILSTPVAGGSAGENMEAGARRGVGIVRDIYRQTRLTSGGDPETEFGQKATETFDTAMTNLPPVAGVHGTLQTPSGGVAAARRAVGDTARAAGDAALEAATPRLSPRSMELVGKATDAGVPINFHQLSDNKFMKIIGETAENVPMAGGGSLRAKRREAFNLALAKQMDPETDITVLDDISFKQLQDAAGERIGEISSKYQVPVTEFGNLMGLDRVRRGTPDTQAVVKAWADDLKRIADENGGIVPGDTLRKLRTEIQAQAREMRANKGDVAATLDDVVHRMDDALANVAADADVAALTDARRRYAISKVLEPLVARHPDGNFAPSALKNIMAQKSGGKQRRMARGEAGDLGEYARIGNELLKELPSSGTAERNLVYGGVGAGAGAGAAFAEPLSAAAIYLGSAAYNLVGPRVVKRLVDAQRRRDAPAPERPPAEPTLGQGFEDVPQGRPGSPGAPLGDLTPDWETAPGAMPPREQGIDPTGMVRAVDEAEPLPQGIPQRPGAQIPVAEERPLGDLTPDWETQLGADGAGGRGAEPGLVPALGDEAPTTGTRVDMRSRAGQQIPAVPGRPGLPDTLTVGGPAESAATAADNAAMVTPGAIEARRQQGMAAVERAAEAERAEPVPVGEATEIRPQNVRPAPEMPDEPIPVGEATEITPENVRPAPEVREHPEVAKIRQEIAKKREAEAKKQAAADELRAAAAAETDPEVKAALIKRADAIAPAKKEKTDGTPSEPVGTGGVRQEAGQEGVQEGGGGQAAKGGEEALSLDFPKIDEGLMDLQQRVTERVAPPPAPSPRGRRQVRRALERGIAEGTLDKDGASLALWALDRNENLARGLRLEIAQPEMTPEGPSPAKGSYNSATRIVKVFQGKDNPQTAVHEILHHAERMMPEAVQQGIYRAWQRALKAATEDASPERRAALDALNKVSSNDMTALDSVKRAFKDGVLKADDYQLVNPTEYWAVNGARIMHERFTGRGSWRAQARQWLREMIEHVKETVGVRSDSPLLKALNEMLDAEKNTGAQRSPTMIKNRPEGGDSLTSTKQRK